MTHESERAAVCLACGGHALTTVETTTARALADAWRAEDRASGTVAHGDSRTEALLSVLPDTIHFDRCPACGLEKASPAVVWSSSAYPRDQSYPTRWEFLRCVEELGSVAAIGDDELTFKVLEHLSANPGRGVAKTPGKTPFDAVYRWVG